MGGLSDLFKKSIEIGQIIPYKKTEKFNHCKIFFIENENHEILRKNEILQEETQLISERLNTLEQHVGSPSSSLLD